MLKISRKERTQWFALLDAGFIKINYQLKSKVE